MSGCIDSSSITNRLANLKAAHDTQITSDSKEPTPLRVFLTIYLKAQGECYPQYMRGAEVLAKYLAPIELPGIPLSWLDKKIPDFYSGYETQELSRILTPIIIGEPLDSYLQRRDYVEKIILHCITKEIIGNDY